MSLSNNFYGYDNEAMNKIKNKWNYNELNASAEQQK